jgi:hypothetical protein
MKILPKMFHHPPLSPEKYIYDDEKNMKMCNNSQRFGLESGKHAAIVSLCHWSGNFHDMH